MSNLLTGSLISRSDAKNTVRVATTAALTLATDVEVGDTIDGVVLVAKDRVLIKDQVAGAENGIYDVQASGAPKRSCDANSSKDVNSGMNMFVAEGSFNADKYFQLTTDDPIVLGTTALVFAEVGIPIESFEALHCFTPGAAFTTVQDHFTTLESAGLISGGTINDAGGGMITVDAGEGTIRVSDSVTAKLNFISWSALPSTAVPADTIRYVVVAYNAGSPRVEIRTSAVIDTHDEFGLGRVVNLGGDLSILPLIKFSGNTPSRVQDRLFEVTPVARDNFGGGLILGTL